MITLKQFITEDDYEGNFNEFMRALKQDCQPFLSINARNLKKGKYLWRGAFKPENINFFSRFPRADRKPLSTNVRVHEYFDKFFEKEFDFKYRSSSLFVSQDRYDADGYKGSPGSTFAIFPAQDYTMLASNNIRDLFAADYSDKLRSLVHKLGDPEYSNDSMTQQDDEDFSEELKKLDYFETKNFDKINFDNEIMIKCKKYYAIRLTPEGIFTQLGNHNDSIAEPVNFTEMLFTEV